MIRIAYDMGMGNGDWPAMILPAAARLDESIQYTLYPNLLEGGQVGSPPLPKLANVCSAKESSPNLAGQLHQLPAGGDLESMLGGPDIIHLAGPYCPLLLRRARVVVTLTESSCDLTGGKMDAQARAGQMAGLFNAAVFADRFFCVGEKAAQNLRELFPGIAPSKIVVVGKDVDADARRLVQAYRKIAAP